MMLNKYTLIVRICLFYISYETNDIIYAKRSCWHQCLCLCALRVGGINQSTERKSNYPA